MIDEKKIEEAKRAFIADKKILGVISIIDLSCGFKEGAQWAINEFLKNLWHPSSEKPKKGRVFLYKTIFKGYGLNQIINGNEWEYTIKYQKATQWLYIDDLLPKEEDGNEKE